MVHDPPHASFVIPVRNDPDRLRECLASIKANQSEGINVEVIVGDNGSTDETAAVAREAGAHVLSLPGLVVAAVRNQAARAAHGNVLAFVDADHRLSPGWLASALASLRDPAVVGAGAPCHSPTDGTWVQRMYDSFRDHGCGAVDVEWLGGGNLVVRRDAFLDVGGFDASLTTCEDVDLCERLRARGGRILNDPRMVNTHLGDPATLRALFVGELWRGRDNLRVSVRHQLSWRALPSIAIPIADLLLMGLAALGVIATSMGGLWLSAASLSVVSMFAALRAAVMLRRLGSYSIRDAAQAFVVALTYDVARALALVWRGSHLARQRAEAR